MQVCVAALPPPQNHLKDEHGRSSPLPITFGDDRQTPHTAVSPVSPKTAGHRQVYRYDE